MMTEAAAPLLPTPRSLDDTGLTAEQVEQLIIKTLHGGESSGLALAEHLRLPYTILEPRIERTRTELLVEVRGSTGPGSAGYATSTTANTSARPPFRSRSTRRT